MSTTLSNSSGGIGFAGLLTVLFIGLKLIGYITWSWVWVLLPLWILMAVGFAMILCGFIILAILAITTYLLED